jgi:hypothetical protein
MIVLTYDAYKETLDIQKEKEDKLTIMEERFGIILSQMQFLITALGSMEYGSVNEKSFRKTAV